MENYKSKQTRKMSLLHLNQTDRVGFDIFHRSSEGREGHEGSCFYALQHYW